MKDKIHIALEKMFFEHYDEWCLLSYMYLKNKIEAEEVVQDVCVKILLRDPSVEIINLKAYVTTAIKNGSLQKIKHSEKFDALSESNIRIAPSSEENLILSEDKLHLQKAIASLPEPSKNVFNLCVIEGQKYQNVADELGVSVNTIKYHIKKAYRTLRIRMEDVYFWIVFVVISLLF